VTASSSSPTSVSETPSGEAAERSQNSCEHPGREPDPAGLGPRLPGKLRFVKQAFGPRAKAAGMTWEQWQELLASRTQPRRLMTLAEMANVAVFIAPACHAEQPADHADHPALHSSRAVPPGASNPAERPVRGGRLHPRRRQPGGRAGTPGMPGPSPAPWPPGAITTNSVRSGNHHSTVEPPDHQAAVCAPEVSRQDH
jgi:hypothetical protein